MLEFEVAAALRDQSVTFEWRADQTALGPFLKGLAKLLKTAGE